MKNNDLLTQLLIFLASIITTFYALFSKDSKEAINRTLLLGKNQRFGHLTKFGKVICKILDTIDKNHCEKSIVW